LLKGDLEYLPPKVETQQMPQDVFEHTWSGGGGYGDPLDRQPEKVMVDVLNDAVSIKAAETVYGVIVKDGTIDLAATEKKRSQIRADRLGSSGAGKLKTSKTSIDGKRISRHLVLTSDNGV